MTPEALKALVRTVPDFPKPGILFRDVTTLIGHPQGFSATIELMAQGAQDLGLDALAGIEARGFIFGGALSTRMGLGFLPLRKPGKLPVSTLAVDYDLEYGTDTLEIDPAAIRDGMRVLVVDDLIASGGTAIAAIRLLRQAGALVEHALFAIDLPDLGGMDRLREEGVAGSALISFPGH